MSSNGKLKGKGKKEDREEQFDDIDVFFLSPRSQGDENKSNACGRCGDTNQKGLKTCRNCKELYCESCQLLSTIKNVCLSGVSHCFQPLEDEELSGGEKESATIVDFLEIAKSPSSSSTNSLAKEKKSTEGSRSPESSRSTSPLARALDQIRPKSARTLSRNENDGDEISRTISSNGASDDSSIQPRLHQNQTSTPTNKPNILSSLLTKARHRTGEIASPPPEGSSSPPSCSSPTSSSTSHSLAAGEHDSNK